MAQEVVEVQTVVASQGLLQVRQSYGRMLAHGGLFERFYDILIQRSPKVARMFAHTDLSQQYELLEQSITMSLLFPQGNVIANQAVARIRASHRHDRLNIEPAMYELWLDSLMQAFAEHDPFFSDELEADWRRLLSVTINHIKSGYHETT